MAPNLYEPTFDEEAPEYRRARLGHQAGSEHLGASLWELPPGGESPFHYHLGIEELLVVVRGRPTLRTGAGLRPLHEGDVVAFPRGERGAHALRNDTDEPVRVLLVSEMRAPNVSVYPDEGFVGVYDRSRREERRFGALFDVERAVSDYGGGRAEIVPPPQS